MSIRIIIADDHQLFLDGLMLILAEMDDVELVAHAGNGKDVLRLLRSHKADMLLLDINMPVMNGLEALKEVKKSYPEIRVIVLSMHYEKYMVSRIMQDGADGYLLKSGDKDEFKLAIKRVHAGSKYFSSELTSVLLKEHNNTGDGKAALLSSREVEIISLLAEGLGSTQISEKISISPRTVDTHRNNILHKLELKNTAELISFAFRNKLLNSD